MLREASDTAAILPAWRAIRGYSETICRYAGVRLTVPEMDTDAFRNDPLAQAIIKGHQYARLMESDKYDTVLQLSQALRLDRSAVAKKLALANLCPEVIEAVFSGTAPESLNLSKVTQVDDWGEQKRLFGLE